MKPNATKWSTSSGDYNNAGQFCLNRYIMPKWQLGQSFERTRCPSDSGTLKAPNVTVAGIVPGAIVSSFELCGTSYATNIQPELPWRGHGARVAPVETASNQQIGPNFSPEAIYTPCRYIMTADLAIFHINWSKFLVSKPLGRKADRGRWHEAQYGVPWQNAIALFADGHVAFGAYPFPVAPAELTDLRSYEAPYPLKLAPK